MAADAKRYCESCQAKKQIVRPTPQAFTPVHNINERVAIDLIGPFKATASGNRWILTTTDSLDRFAWSLAIPDAEATTVWKALRATRFAYFGAPDYLQSDRGANLIGNVAKATLASLGTLGFKTTAYNPQSNGIAEAYNKTLIGRLSHLTDYRQSDWDVFLTDADMAYNLSPHSAIDGKTPFECRFGYLPRHGLASRLSRPAVNDDVNRVLDDMRLHREVMHHVIDAANEQSQRANQERANEHVTAKPFTPGDMVLVYFPSVGTDRKAKFSRLWIGPFRIQGVEVRQGVPVLYKIESFNNRRVSSLVNARRLKPFVSRLPGELGFDPKLTSLLPPDIDLDDPNFGDSHLDLREWEIDHITGHRKHRTYGLQYRVRWLGFPPSYDTWEPVSELKDASAAISDYVLRLRRAPGRRLVGRGGRM